MRVRIMLLVLVCCTVAACGNSRNDKAAAACGAEIASRLAGKTYQIDLRDLARHAKSESANTLLLTSTIVFDKGLSSQYQQTYECRVRMDNADTASVLYLQFNWNTGDLQQAR